MPCVNIFQELDGADDLLNAEKQHLLKLKRILEAQLRSVQKQLQVLDNARKRLKAVLSERSRVMDLICETVPSSRSKGRSEKNTERLGKINFVIFEISLEAAFIKRNAKCSPVDLSETIMQ